jgi:hypothetical protein
VPKPSIKLLYIPNIGFTIGKLHLVLKIDTYIEAAFRQYSLLGNTPAGIHVLVAASSYLAAHAPTMRSQGQTYHMAYRLHRGDRVFEEAG